jgi:hypothetical protein
MLATLAKRATGLKSSAGRIGGHELQTELRTMTADKYIGVTTAPRQRRAPAAANKRVQPRNAVRAHYVIRSATPVCRSIEFNEAEVLDGICRCISDMRLDLAGCVVVAGAAGESQAITATAAALAGAGRVIAISPKAKRQPRAGGISANALALASYARVSERVEIVTSIHPRIWQQIDILVNCQQVSPISRSAVERLVPTAVVALMAEPWELQPGIVDTEACKEMHIKVAAPNLRHPSIALLPELAQLCCHLVAEAGIDALDANIAVLCDTPCRPFIEQALADQGATVSVFPHPLLLPRGAWDAIVVALRPSDKPPMDINGLASVCDRARGARLVQFSGEIDRLAARYFGFSVWPPRRPGRGQLGIPQEVLGPFPLIRRHVGGLKAAEALKRGIELEPDGIGFVVDNGGLFR